MKKLYATIVVLLLAMTLNWVYGEEKNVTLNYNGNTVEFGAGEGEMFLDEEGTLQIPVKKIAELTGAALDINEEKQRIQLSTKSASVTLIVGEKQMWDGNAVAAKSAPKHINGVYYVPAEPVFKKLLCEASWNPEKTVISVQWKDEPNEISVSLGDIPNFNISDFEIFEDLPDATPLFRQIEAEDTSKLPNGTFKVSYFDICEPDRVLGTEILNDMTFGESQGMKFGLSANRVGAVIVGNILVDKEQDQMIRFSHEDWLSGWGKVYVDGTLIVNTLEKDFGAVHLKKGRHRVVVELINNKCVTTLSVTFEKNIPVIEESGIAQYLQTILTPDTLIQYCDIPDSFWTDGTPVIELAASKKPILLFLSGYTNSVCRISVPKGTELQGIVMNELIKIEGIDRAKVKHVIFPQLEWCYGIYPTGEDRGGNYEMMDSGFRALDRQIQKITGKQLHSMCFPGAAEPNYILDSGEYQRIQSEYQRIDKLVADGPVKLENLYGEQSVVAGKTMASALLGDLKVPENAFRGIYIDTDHPKTIVETEVLDQINILYFDRDFWGIQAEKIGACWIGDWTFGKDETREIAVDGSWNNFKVFVDGVEVMQGDGGQTILYKFTKGKHRIEVDFVSNYFATGFHVAIAPPIEIKTHGKMKREVQKMKVSNPQFFFLSGVEAQGTNRKTQVVLKKEKRPVVLILDSYNSIQWEIQNPESTKIVGILIRTYSDASTVKVEGVEGVPMYRFDPSDSYDITESSRNYVYDLMDNPRGELFNTVEKQGFTPLLNYMGIDRIDGCSMLYGGEDEVPAIRIP